MISLRYINLENLNDLGLSGQKFLEDNFNVNESVAILEHFIEQ